MLVVESHPAGALHEEATKANPSSLVVLDRTEPTPARRWAPSQAGGSFRVLTLKCTCTLIGILVFP